jgi:UDP-GlcNAc3NAcA epimerase
MMQIVRNKKILTVIGARPQFVKAAALSRSIAQEPDLDEVVVHTGQHFDVNMSDVFFNELNIPKPKYVLNINSLSHGAMTGRMLEEIEKIILIEKPDALLVFGDTNSTLAGALAASKLHVPVAHVEAGLRSYNMLMPEEQNRRLTDAISKWLFCPSDAAVDCLVKEGITEDNAQIAVVGDVMYDALLNFNPFAKLQANVPDSFALLTLHRAENTDDVERMKEIVSALNVLVDSGMAVVFPVHPRTKKILAEYKLSDQVQCIEPVGYLEMLGLLQQCSLVLTDSGGLQKEAYFSGKNCVTLRTETEWIELIDLGVNVLANTAEDIVFEAQRRFDVQVDNSNPVYGDGKACEKIVIEMKKGLYA